MKLIVFNAEKTRNSFIHDLKRSFWSSERWRSARWIYKRLFFVHNLIKYGQYRSIKVNQVQLRLIRVNWGMSICQSVHLLVGHGASKLGMGGNKTPRHVTHLLTYYTRFPIIRCKNEKNRLAKSWSTHFLWVG